jgi:hypothetical protein
VRGRSYPEELPPLEDHPSDAVRRTSADGVIRFRGRVVKVGKAFRGQPVGVRPTATDGVWEVHVATTAIATINLHEADPR